MNTYNVYLSLAYTWMDRGSDAFLNIYFFVDSALTVAIVCTNAA